MKKINIGELAKLHIYKKDKLNKLVKIGAAGLGILGIGYLIGHFAGYMDCLDQIKENKDFITHGIGLTALRRFLEKLEIDVPDIYEKLHAYMLMNPDESISSHDIDVDWLTGAVTAEIHGVKITMF